MKQQISTRQPDVLKKSLIAIYKKHKRNITTESQFAYEQYIERNKSDLSPELRNEFDKYMKQ